MPSDVELLLRLLGAALLGGAVGLEREVRGQPAGFRTHILVALGSCLFTVISAYGFGAFLGEGADPQFRFDPTRIAAQIVTGIGFLGAGAILRYGITVRGLTTAASLWVVAAIGMAVGVGAYVISSVSAGITLLALVGLRPLRTRLVRGLKKEHEEFRIEAGPDLDLGGLIKELEGTGVQVENVRVEEEEGVRDVVLFVVVPADRRPEEAVAVLTRHPGVRTAEWTR
ncbi:MAG: MgtC/SapB family protein [Actinomycetota bacterium]